MERPTPIIWFSRYYLASLALRVAFAIVHWDVADAGSVEINIIISLLLWFGVMYRHSVVAKWLVILVFIASTIWTVVQLSSGGYDLLSILVFGAGLILNAMSAWQLLIDAAQIWFEQPVSSEPG